MESVEGLFGAVGDFTWGWSLVPLLVVFGIFITALTGFVQFRFFKRMFRVLSKHNQTGDPNAISAREALLISVGGRVGGGNIAGVAVAITLGGPGAVFWMWAIALWWAWRPVWSNARWRRFSNANEPDGRILPRRPGNASIMHGLGQ